MCSMQSSHQFSRLRSYLWPVYRHELPKLMPLLIICFLLSFNYNILRSIKDTLIITARSSDADTIPFVKFWMMLPGAFFMTFVYTRLTNRFDLERIFYIMVGGFLTFFCIFTFFIYPYHETIHLDSFADTLQGVLPAGCKGFIAMLRNWSFSLYYVMSELWSPIILFLVLWGFINQVTNVDQAKRFFALFGVGMNFSGMFAGRVSHWFSAHEFNPNLPLGNDRWHQTLIFLTLTVLFCGSLAIALFRWVHRHNIIEEVSVVKHFKGSSPKKIKMSLRESFAYLARSRYLLCIAVIVIAYNFAINITEVVWKSQVKALFNGDRNQINAYMSDIVTSIGLTSTMISLFILGNTLRLKGWTFTAMITPVILSVTSIAFFGCILFPDFSNSLLFAGGDPKFPILGGTFLSTIVLLGSFQNIMSRSAKYTVYDASKEIAFTPLPKESKLKGKAAIDGVGSRIGKSGGSLFLQGLMIQFGSLSVALPYIASALAIVTSIWIIAVHFLGKRFNKLIDAYHQQEESKWTKEEENRAASVISKQEMDVQEKVC